MGLSSLATVHEHLEALVKKKVIRKFEGAVRGLEIIDERISQALQGVEIPLVGYIAAGQPIEAIEDPTTTVLVSPEMVSTKKRTFVLQVKGDSMREMGILDGDYVVCEESTTANNGEVVVALLDDGFATLKCFYREKTRIRLEPANAEMSPIYAKEVKIQGKVVGVVRRYA